MRPSHPQSAPQPHLQTLHNLSNSVEALANIIFLIPYDRDDPERVLELTKLAETQVQCQIELLHTLQAQAAS